MSSGRNSWCNLQSTAANILSIVWMSSWLVYGKRFWTSAMRSLKPKKRLCGSSWLKRTSICLLNKLVTGTKLVHTSTSSTDKSKKKASSPQYQDRILLITSKKPSSHQLQRESISSWQAKLTKKNRRNTEWRTANTRSSKCSKECQSQTQSATSRHRAACTQMFTKQTMPNLLEITLTKRFE